MTAAFALLPRASSFLLSGSHTTEINTSGFFYELISGTRFGPSRRTNFAGRYDSLLSVVFKLGLIPHHFKTATVVNFRMAFGIPRKVDLYEDADVFDEFIDRVALKCVREGEYTDHQS